MVFVQESICPERRIEMVASAYPVKGGKLFRKNRRHLLFSRFFVSFVVVLKGSGTASDYS